MIPRMHKKGFDSKHFCPCCRKRMAKGEFVVEFLEDVYYGKYKYRMAHLECVLARSPDVVQKRGTIAERLRKKIAKEIFMEAI